MKKVKFQEKKTNFDCVSYIFITFKKYFKIMIKIVDLL